MSDVTSLKAGDRIPGSLFRRDFCARCGTPMRVVSLYDDENRRKKHYCEECDPHAPDYQPLCRRQESVRRRQSDRTI